MCVMLFIAYFCLARNATVTDAKHLELAYHERFTSDVILKRRTKKWRTSEKQ